MKRVITAVIIGAAFLSMIIFVCIVMYNLVRLNADEPAINILLVVFGAAFVFLAVLAGFNTIRDVLKGTFILVVCLASLALNAQTSRLIPANKLEVEHCDEEDRGMVISFIDTDNIEHTYQCTSAVWKRDDFIWISFRYRRDTTFLIQGMPTTTMFIPDDPINYPHLLNLPNETPKD